MSSKKKASKATPDGISGTRLSRGRTRPEAIFPVAPSAASLPESYAATLQEIKSHLRSARVRAILAANPIVIEAYWHTGKIILARQQEAAWGAKVIDRLAEDLQAEFPDMSGLTSRNLLSMKIFAREFPDGPIAKQPVSQLPWGHIIRLMQMVKDPAVRDFYICETLAQGWSRSILEIQVENQLHLRLGKAQNNFAMTMPLAESDMAAQLFKDPYLFDFLGTADPRREAEVEQALVDHIQKFLLELGTGFAFVGRQVRLEVGGSDYPIDLLFYHLKLRRFVVIELKPSQHRGDRSGIGWRAGVLQIRQRKRIAGQGSRKVAKTQRREEMKKASPSKKRSNSASLLEPKKEETKPPLVPKLRFPEFREAINWSTKPLGELGDFSSGGTPSKDNPEFWNGHIPWISASSMHTTTIAKSDYCVSSKAIGNGTRIAPKGSFLILVRGSMLFNRVPMGIAEIDVAFNQDVKALAPSGEVNTRFLLCFLSAIESQIQINETGIGAGKIDTDVLKALPIQFPTPAEQQKIASCLSSVDDLMAAQARKVDALKTHKKGLMQQLFPREGETQPRLRFPEFKNAGDWAVKPLGSAAENLDNRRRPITSSDRQAGDVPYYGASGIVDYVEGFIFDEDLLCVSEDGANLVARTYPIAFPISGKTWVNNHAHVLRFANPCTRKFVEVYLNSTTLDDFITGMAQPKLNKAMLDKIPIPYPEIPEQQRIASCLTSLDDLITAETQKLEALKIHKKGLMQQLFPSLEEAP